MTIYDGASNQMAQTKYGYDESPYGSVATAGDPTSTSRWTAGSNFLTSYTTFNASGVIAGTTDIRSVPSIVNGYDCNGSMPNSVTTASGTSVAETVTYAHDCMTGALTSFTDANMQTTSYHYVDSLDRITSVSYPDSGLVNITYTDGSASSVAIQTATGGTQGSRVQTVLYDGLGRTKQVQMNAGSSGTIYQDTTYDGMGRKASQSNPYYSGSGISTTYQYDALGRASLVNLPGTATQSWSYSGATTTFTDENLNQWKRTTDALGRLTNVVEPNGSSQSPTLSTDYGYDALGNLQSVTQHGAGGESARSRSFSYDSLSRLTSSTNPGDGSYYLRLSIEWVPLLGRSQPSLFEDGCTWEGHHLHL